MYDFLDNIHYDKQNDWVTPNGQKYGEYGEKDAVNS